MKERKQNEREQREFEDVDGSFPADERKGE